MKDHGDHLFDIGINIITADADYSSLNGLNIAPRSTANKSND